MHQQEELQNAGPDFFSGLFGSAVDERMRNNLCDVKSCVHIFSGSFGSFDSAVNERARNNLYDV